MKDLSPYQKKFLLLCGGLLVFLILAYQLSFKKALEEWRSNDELIEKSEFIANLDVEMMKWNRLNSDLESRFGNTIDQSFHESLLNMVGNFCDDNKLTLTEFSEPFEGTDEGYSVETIILTIQGKYKPLLQLLHSLETKFQGGKISSVQFLKERNFRTGRDELFLKLYVQKIKKKDE